MTTTCSVEGCKKTFTHDLVTVNNVNTPVSFHRFPRSKTLRQKWLTAIGRPNWDAPITAHVCSRHFSHNQLDFLDNNMYKIKDGGYPDRVFPILSDTSVGASNVEVCRFCLATNLKMFSLQSGVLKTCLETFVGLHQNHDVDGLPQYLCYICAAYLLKMYNVIEKSMIAQATLLEIYTENLEITKKLIFEHNRQKLNLVHSLRSYNSTPCTVFDYVYDENLNVSVPVTDRVESYKQEEDRSTKDSSMDISDSESEQRAKHLNSLCRILKQDIAENEKFLTDIYDEPFILDDDISSETHAFTKSQNIHGNTLTKLQDVEENYEDMNSHLRDTNITTIIQKHVLLVSGESDDNIRKENESVYVKDHVFSSSCVDASKLLSVHDNTLEDGNTTKKKDIKRTVSFSTQTDYANIDEVQNILVKKKSLSRNCGDKNNAISKKYPPLDKFSLESYYNIEELTLDKQRQQWLKSCEKALNSTESVYCEVCSKWLKSEAHYIRHMIRHNPQRGDYECQVCKVRFAQQFLLTEHIAAAHANSYLCKLCPAVLYNAVSATVHYWAHTRGPHLCERCGYSFSTRAGLRLHATSVHRATRLNHKIRHECNACGVNFSSKSARRAHLSTCPAREATPPFSREPVSPTLHGVHEAYTNAPYYQGEEPASYDYKPSMEASYDCPICDDVFRSSATLNQHIMDEHQQPQLAEPPDSSSETMYLDNEQLIDLEEVIDVNDADAYSNTMGMSDYDMVTAENKYPLEEDSDWNDQENYMEIETLDIDYSEEEF